MSILIVSSNVVLTIRLKLRELKIARTTIYQQTAKNYFIFLDQRVQARVNGNAFRIVYWSFNLLSCIQKALECHMLTW